MLAKGGSICARTVMPSEYWSIETYFGFACW